MERIYDYLQQTPVTRSQQAAGLLRDDLSSLDHEESWILLLNAAGMPLQKRMLTAGTLTSTIIDIRRIVKLALLGDATSVILAHNHPSGNPQPSAADISETEKLRQACGIFDISLIDHIIICERDYYSFADETRHTFAL